MGPCHYWHNHYKTLVSRVRYSAEILTRKTSFEKAQHSTEMINSSVCFVGKQHLGGLKPDIFVASDAK